MLKFTKGMKKLQFFRRKVQKGWFFVKNSVNFCVLSGSVLFLQHREHKSLKPQRHRKRIILQIFHQDGNPIVFYFRKII